MSPEKKKEWIDLLPVCYAVTYVFGTIGSAWILGNIGPKLLGGLEKVKKATKELEEKLNHSAIGNDPAYVDGNQPIIFRAYKVTAEHFRTSRTVGEIENHFMASHKRLFVERVRNEDGIITQPSPKLAIRLGNEIVLSGRHEFLVGDESWIGPEINDTKLLTFAVERTRVMVSKKTAGLTIDQLRVKPFMYGVMIESLTRQGIDIPVLAQTQLAEGDMLTIMGLPQEVDTAAPAIGFEERPTTHTDMVFFGFALAIGAIVGAIKINFGAVPVSLSTSGGALIGGLFFGWLRTKRPSIGYIPSSSLWLMNNLGLNIFIAVIGIESGPTFVSGIQDVGFMLFIMGIVSTSLPLIIAVYLGEKLFKFHPAINLGCCAGSRTTTASLGAITTALGSSVPALGYTVTYAVGNTVLILMGVAMVLLSI